MGLNLPKKSYVKTGQSYVVDLRVLEVRSQFDRRLTKSSIITLRQHMGVDASADLSSAMPGWTQFLPNTRSSAPSDVYGTLPATPYREHVEIGLNTSRSRMLGSGSGTSTIPIYGPAQPREDMRVASWWPKPRLLISISGGLTLTVVSIMAWYIRS